MADRFFSRVADFFLNDSLAVAPMTRLSQLSTIRIAMMVSQSVTEDRHSRGEDVFLSVCDFALAILLSFSLCRIPNELQDFTVYLDEL